MPPNPLSAIRRRWLEQNLINAERAMPAAPPPTPVEVRTNIGTTRNRLINLKDLVLFVPNGDPLRVGPILGVLNRDLGVAEDAAEEDPEEAQAKAQRIQELAEGLEQGHIRGAKLRGVNDVLLARRRLFEKAAGMRAARLQENETAIQALKTLANDVEAMPDLELPEFGPELEPVEFKKQVNKRFEDRYGELLKKVQKARQVRSNLQALAATPDNSPADVTALALSIHSGLLGLLQQPELNDSETKLLTHLDAQLRREVDENGAVREVSRPETDEYMKFEALLKPSRDQTLALMNTIEAKFKALKELRDSHLANLPIDQANSEQDPADDGSQALREMEDRLGDAQHLLANIVIESIPVEAAATLDFAAMMQGRERIKSSLRGERILRKASKQVQAFMAVVPEATRKDLVMDFKLKTDDELRQDIIRAKGWVEDPLSPQHAKWVDNYLAGLKDVLSQNDTARITMEGDSPRTLNLGGTPFENNGFLGAGAFGNVHKFTATVNGEQRSYAVKTMQPKGDTDQARAEERATILQEIRSHYHLTRQRNGEGEIPGRENIVQLIDVAKDDQGGLHVVMEILEGGDLNKNRMGMNRASETGIISEEVQTFLNVLQLKQALQGMQFLQRQGTIHFDLKPENIFMGADGGIKIGDFGCAASTSTTDGNVGDWRQGDTQFKAETNVMDGRTVKEDVFSMGLIAEMLLKRTQGPQKQRTAKQAKATNTLDGMIAAMTDKLTDQRPTPEAVLQTSVFRRIEQVNPEQLAKLSQLGVQYTGAIGEVYKAQIGAIRATVAPLIGKALDDQELTNGTSNFARFASFIEDNVTRVIPKDIALLQPLVAVKRLPPGEEQDRQLTPLLNTVRHLLKRSTAEIEAMTAEDVEAVIGEQEDLRVQLRATLNFVDAQDNGSEELRAAKERLQVIADQMREVSAQIEAQLRA